MELAYRFRGSVRYHHSGKHGSIQADMVLEKELRVLHLDPKAAEGDCLSYSIELSICDLWAHLHSDILPPTKPHLLIVLLPIAMY